MHTVRHIAHSSRPWQHVLESLNGYLILSEKLFKSYDNSLDSFNFGPDELNNRTVNDLVKKINYYWPCKWQYAETKNQPYESKRLFHFLESHY